MIANHEAQRLLATDPDWINSKRFDNSLKKLQERYPDGAPTKVIATALMVTEDELETLEREIIVKLRRELQVD